MMLMVLDKNPITAAHKLYELTNAKFCFKQLIALAQLICSAGFSNVYKSVPQGKEIRVWIKKNPLWIYYFGLALQNIYLKKIKVQFTTINNLRKYLIVFLKIIHTNLWKREYGDTK